MPSANKSCARVSPPARIATQQAAAGALANRNVRCGKAHLKHIVIKPKHLCHRQGPGLPSAAKKSEGWSG